MESEIQILKLISGEEIIGYTVPSANTMIKYNVLVNANTHSGVFDRSTPKKGVTIVFASIVERSGFVTKRWLNGEVSWSTLLEQKEIPYMFIPDKLIMCKVVGNRIDERTIQHYERYLRNLQVRNLLNVHFDDNLFRRSQDSGSLDAGSQAVS